jgi:hypothetical protein
MGPRIDRNCASKNVVDSAVLDLTSNLVVTKHAKSNSIIGCECIATITMHKVVTSCVAVVIDPSGYGESTGSERAAIAQINVISTVNTFELQRLAQLAGNGRCRCTHSHKLPVVTIAGKIARDSCCPTCGVAIEWPVADEAILECRTFGEI